MTGSGKPGPDLRDSGVFDAEDLALMEGAIEAVCAELAIAPTDRVRREAVAVYVVRSWSQGSRMPLNLVAAALDGAGSLPRTAA